MSRAARPTPISTSDDDALEVACGSRPFHIPIRAQSPGSPSRGAAQAAFCGHKYMSRLSDFEFLNKLGQGSFGMVHRVRRYGTSLLCVLGTHIVCSWH